MAKFVSVRLCQVNTIIIHFSSAISHAFFLDILAQRIRCRLYSLTDIHC